MADERTAKEIEAAERKAELEAEAVKLDLDKKMADFEEWKTRRGQRDAEASANVFALQLKNEDSQRTAIKDMVPDLSKVDRGSTTVPEGSTVFQALLGGRALQSAASKLIPVVKGSTGLGDDYRLLVTTDLDLATRDADYLSLVKQLDHFRSLIDQFRDSPSKADARELIAPFSVAAAAAQSLPGLLSLISAKRTITSVSSTVDEDVAMIAAAGVLAGADAEGLVIVDRARLLDADGPAQQCWVNLQTACHQLFDLLRDEEAKEHPDADRLAEGKSLLKTCEAALTAMASVPEGARMSALARAASQEALHSNEFGGVLIVKGGAASSTQLVDDRPLRFGDPFSVVTTATICYLLIDHRNGSKLLGGGLVHGTAQIHGKIGSELTLP